MTVEQLIKRLSSLPPKSEVVRLIPGDIHGHTRQPAMYKPFTDMNIQFDKLNVVIY